MKALLNCCAAVFLLACTSPTQTPYLVKDIAVQTQPASSSPGGFERLGNKMLFTADGRGTGIELYSTEGTTATTVLLKDINVGATGSVPAWLTTLGNVCYFTAVTPGQGRELWKTDGTVSGTVLVKDVIPGPVGSDPRAFVRLGNEVFFILGDRSYDLWKTDGTAAGTVLVKRIGAQTTPFGPIVAAESNGSIYFDANGTWVSDGTTAGTRRVDVARPTQIRTVGSDTFIASGLAVTRYSASGKARIYSPAPDVSWVHLATAGGELIFEETTTQQIGPNSRDYYRIYRATRSGSSAYKRDLRIAGETSTTAYLWDGSDAFAYSNGTLRRVGGLTGPFRRDSSRVANGQLFYSLSDRDGLFGFDLRTGVGQRLLPHWIPPGLALRTGVLSNGTVLLPACDASGDCELYETDGTVVNTRLVKDIQPGLSGGNPASNPKFLCHAAGLVYFQAATQATGAELFASDGTSGGTRLIKDLEPGPGSSHPIEFTPLGNKVLFTAWTTQHGHEVFVTDGTAAGTKVLKDLQKPGHGRPVSLTRAGRFVYFTAIGPRYPWLVRTDGTSAGTRLLFSLERVRGFDPKLAAVGNYLFLAANDVAGGGVEPHAFDDTRLYRIADVNAGQRDSNPGSFRVVGDRLFFAAETPARWLLWTPVDGGPVSPVAAQNYVHHARSFDGRLAFWGWDGGVRGSAPFVTNRGATATTKLPISTPDSSPDYLSPFGVAGGKLIVRNRDGVYSSDGTPANTRRLQSFSLTGKRDFFMVGQGGRRVFFPGSTSASGVELWVSDGTAPGTKMVADLNRGAADSLSRSGSPVICNGRLLFAADDGTHGTELWALDLGATAEEIGLGCSPSGRTPVLGATDPVLGGSVSIQLRHAPVNAGGVLIVSAPPSPGSVSVLGHGCAIYTGSLIPPPLLTIRTDSAGSWAWNNVALPGNPSLKGVQLTLQTGVGPSTKAPLGLDLSNGLTLVLDDK